MIDSCVLVRKKEVWKDYMERIMNKDNHWDHNVEGDTVEDQVACVSRDMAVQALNGIKTRKTHGPSDVLLHYY